MKWLPLEEVLKGMDLPDGYTFEKLTVDQVFEFTTSLRVWYPDIKVGSESRFLDPDFYFDNIFTGAERNSDHGNFYPLLAKIDGETAGWLILEKNDDALTVSSPMAGLVPDFRHAGAGPFFTRFLEAMGRAIGAEMVFAIVTLKVQGSQRIIEKNGYQLVGILPAFDRDMVAPGKIRRVFEAIYAKVLVGDEAVLYPPDECLTPTTKALFDFLYKREKRNEITRSYPAPVLASVASR